MSGVTHLEVEQASLPYCPASPVIPAAASQMWSQCHPLTLVVNLASS
jgi:hypothetical protein